MQVKETLKQYILENFLFTDDQSAIDVETSFLETGIVDSTGIAELISFLQSEFDVYVADAEMIPENLDSIGKISEYVKRKKSA